MLNPFIGARLGIPVDDYNGENFDHSGLDFIGDASLLTVSREGMPTGRAGLLRPGSLCFGLVPVATRRSSQRIPVVRRVAAAQHLLEYGVGIGFAACGA